LNDSAHSFFLGRLNYSLKDLEFILYEQLKSDAYDQFREGFSNQTGKVLEYPEIHIEVCPSRR
jgi:hypothetical protein